MKHKEKAKELVDKFINATDYNGYGTECALIAVDEIIKETKLHDKTIYQHGRTFYWQEVKQEIEKL